MCRTYLLVEPSRPLVGDKLVLKAIVLSHERQEALHLRRHVVLDEPKLHTIPAHVRNHASDLSAEYQVRVCPAGKQHYLEYTGK